MKQSILGMLWVFGMLLAAVGYADANVNILQQLQYGNSNSLAGNGQAVIPAGQAFTLTPQINGHQVILTWQIYGGYYLYQKQFQFQLENAPDATIGSIDFPQAVIKQDPYFGEQKIYLHNLQLVVPILGDVPSGAQLQVRYQGCSGSLCYPPQTTPIQLPLGMGQTVGQTERVQQLLNHQHPFLVLWLLFGLGILLTFTPCVLPMIPILSSIIVGQGARSSLRRATGLSLSYILGMAITYAIFGLIIARIGASVEGFLQQAWVLSVAAMLMVLLALSLFGVYRLQVPVALQAKVAKLYPDHRRTTYVNVFVMGMLATLIVSPCTSAPLVGVLGYVAQTGNMALGALALFCLALGMGLPLLIVGMGAGRWVPKAGIWMVKVQRFLGVVMLGVAVWLLSRFLPVTVTAILYALLLMIYPITWGTYRFATTKSQQLAKISGILVTIYGFALFINGLTGCSNYWQPLSFIHWRHQSSTAHADFIGVNNLAALQEQLTIAQQQHQPVLVDFYANWCVECHKMDAEVFSDDQVEQALSSYRLLRVDVTNNDADAQALLHHFDVLGMPTLLIYGAKGQKTQRVSGFVGVSQLLSNLQ